MNRLPQTRVQRVSPYHADIGRQTVAVAPGEPFWRDGIALFGERQYRRNARRLRWRKITCVMPEIALRARVGPISANAGFRDIEIDFHDPPLSPHGFDQEGEPGFKALPEEASTLPEKGILGCLLADRRSATNTTAAGVSGRRLEDCLAIKTAVGAEFSVFTSNGGARHVGVHRGKAHPVLVEAVAGQNIAHHCQCDWGRNEFVNDNPKY